MSSKEIVIKPENTLDVAKYYDGEQYLINIQATLGPYKNQNECEKEIKKIVAAMYKHRIL